MSGAVVVLSIDQITSVLTQYFWVFCRVGGFFLMVPIIGTRLVSARIRLSLALSISVLVAPVIDTVPLISPLSIPGFVVIVQQLLIGFILGFVFQILFQVCIVGGQLIAMQNGLGFATLVDPVNGINVAAVSQFYLMSSNLFFLAMNGHLAMIELLVSSFTQLPIGAQVPFPDLFFALAYRGSWLFESGVLVALPAITALLLVNLSFGIMTKVAPQMNVISVGFPFIMVFGLVIMWISMNGFLPQFQRFSQESLEFMRVLIEA